MAIVPLSKVTMYGPAADKDAVVEFRPDEGDSSEQWVTFVYVPGAPRASRLIVRPWLAVGARPEPGGGRRSAR